MSDFLEKKTVAKNENGGINSLAIREFLQGMEYENEKIFVPGINIVIDEQLVSSHSRSPHKIYKPAKPGKPSIVQYVKLILYKSIFSSRFFLIPNTQCVSFLHRSQKSGTHVFHRPFNGCLRRSSILALLSLNIVLNAFSIFCWKSHFFCLFINSFF